MRHVHEFVISYCLEMIIRESYLTDARNFTVHFMVDLLLKNCEAGGSDEVMLSVSTSYFCDGFSF